MSDWKTLKDKIKMHERKALEYEGLMELHLKCARRYSDMLLREKAIKNFVRVV